MLSSLKAQTVSSFPVLHTHDYFLPDRGSYKSKHMYHRTAYLFPVPCIMTARFSGIGRDFCAFHKSSNVQNQWEVHLTFEHSTFPLECLLSCLCVYERKTGRRRREETGRESDYEDFCLRQIFSSIIVFESKVPRE